MLNNNSYYEFNLKWSDNDLSIRSTDNTALDGEWQEVIVTYSDGNLNLYINA